MLTDAAGCGLCGRSAAQRSDQLFRLLLPRQSSSRLVGHAHRDPTMHRPMMARTLLSVASVFLFVCCCASLLPSAASASLFVNSNGLASSQRLTVQGVDVAAVLSSMQTAINTQQAQINALLARNTALATNLTAAQTQILSLTNQVSSTQTLVSNLASVNSSNLGGVVAALTTRVIALESLTNNMESMAPASSPLVSAVLGNSANASTLAAAAAALTSRVLNLESLSASSSTLVNTVIAMRDLTPPGSSPLVSTLLKLNNTAPVLGVSCWPFTLSAGTGGTAVVSPLQSAGCASGSYVAGAALSLTATPSSGYSLSAWSGAAASSGSLLSTVMVMPNAPATASATFGICYSLSVSAVTGGSVAATSGSTSSCVAGSFVAGTSVTLTATPSLGFLFTSFSGTASSTSNPFTFVMPASAVSQAANFAACFALSVPAVTGGSAVASPPSSTGCGLGFYLAGQPITLTATPTTNYVFSAWTGSASSSASSFVFVMPGGAATEIAVFASCVALMVGATAGGSAALSPTNSAGCSAGYFLAGTTVTLTATPTAGNVFVGWSGSVSSSLASFSYMMPSSAIVETAAFSACHALTISVSFGSASASPTNTAGCVSGSYTAGTSITLNSLPNSGYGLASWSGVASGTSSLSPTITMPASAATAAATFAACFPLTLSSSAGGSVSASSPNSVGCGAGSYAAGSAITLTAAPGASYAFSSWTGTTASSNAVFAFTMPTAAASETANFVPCYSLTIAAAGSGGSVAASLPNSPGCAAGLYLAAASVTLTATPATSYIFNSWTGTSANAAAVWIYTMPAGPAFQTAQFDRCWALLVGTGIGGTAVAAPTNSPGCPPSSYFAASVVTLTASPAVNYGFTAWTGSSPSVTNPLSFTIPAAASTQTAVFGACFALTLSAVSGTVSALPTGSPGCAAGSYTASASIALTSVANSGTGLVGWTGVGSTGLTATLTMPASTATVTVTFAACYALTISVSAGGTAVASSPNSVSCATGSYIAGATLTLTATPAAAFAFSTWTGTTAGGAAALAFTMPAAAASQTATFVACYPLTLAVIAAGSGTAVASPTSSVGCTNGLYLAGAPITLTATPASAYFLFNSWSGTIANAAAVWSYTMPSSPATQQAVFDRCWTLAVTTGLGGSAAAVPTNSPGCPAGSYFSSTVVSLTGTPSSSYAFASWSGHTASVLNPFNYPMPALAATETATFSLCYPLTLTAPFGTATATPTGSIGCASGYYTAGASIALSSLANSGYGLVGWSGSLIGSALTATLVMPSAAATATATFALCYALATAPGIGGTISRTPLNSVSCPSSYYVPGTLVTHVASPGTGNTFRSWSSTPVGAFSSVTATFTMTMPTAAASITANFHVTCGPIYVTNLQTTLSFATVLSYVAHGGGGGGGWGGIYTPGAEMVTGSVAISAGQTLSIYAGGGGGGYNGFTYSGGGGGAGWMGGGGGSEWSGGGGGSTAILIDSTVVAVAKGSDGGNNGGKGGSTVGGAGGTRAPGAAGSPGSQFTGGNGQEQ